MGHPTVYPTGTTLYSKDRAYNGYTLFNAPGKGALLIDMNGAEVHLWKGLNGFPNKMLPGGHVLGSRGLRSPKYGMQDQIDLVQVDWQGNVVWSFDRLELITDPGKSDTWMARQHHDYQRSGNPVGYYAPNLAPQVDSGTTLILCHKNVYQNAISDKWLLDDVFIEVDWQGNIIWQWAFSDHFDELNFSQEAKNVLFRDPNMRSAGGGMGDYLHINTMSRLGPNRHYDSGNEAFHPDNIIWDSREANIIGITSRATGKIVWQIGPDYRLSELRHLGWIIGPHHAHMIPQGLPGAGNILIFDNGGWAGYGAPNPSSLYGLKNAWRDSSRVIEFDPVTLNIAWRHSAEELGFAAPMDASRFYSPYVSSAQRLPNGNTLITEGSDGRLIEVTAGHEIVWEYVSPYWREGEKRNNMIYRAYRIPYDWAPQVEKPQEIDISPLDIHSFRMPNAKPKDTIEGVQIDGIIPLDPNDSSDVLCIASSDTRVPTAVKENRFDLNAIFTPLMADRFTQTINDDGEALVLFGAQWCKNCHALHQFLPQLLTSLRIEQIYYTSVDDAVDIARQHGIRGVPTLVVFRQGIAFARLSGLKEKAAVRQFLADNLAQ